MRPRFLLIATAVAGPLALSGVARAAPEPPTPGFAATIEGFASYDPQDTCDPSAKPGTVSFRDFILATYPSTGNSGIVRACNVGGTSEHKEGRAWDWTANVNSASQKDIADTVLAWLLETDSHGNACALARRTGMMYFIWNKRIWGSYRSPNSSCATAGWQNYSGSNPHTDHVHFSFAWPGAKKQTSWWTAPLPVSCDRSAAGFTFSCDGEQPNMHCVNVDEPADPDTWSDNYFCSTLPLDMEWSSTGPIADMECTGVHEASEPLADEWSDNYLCVPAQSPYALSYSSAGPIDGKSCVHWNEPGDQENSWHDNFVCTERVYVFSEGGFSFSMAGALDGKHCVNVDEPGDPDTWTDNHFCSDEAIGMRWSWVGPIEGMECTNVVEAAESVAEAWSNNHLCVPPGSQVRFTWSSAGPIDGMTCVRWFDHAETSPTWIDNWMCIEDLAPPPGSGGAGGWSGGGGDAGAAGSESQGGPGQETHTLEGEETGCACRTTRAPSSRQWMVALLALGALRRRRQRLSRAAAPRACAGARR